MTVTSLPQPSSSFLGLGLKVLAQAEFLVIFSCFLLVIFIFINEKIFVSQIIVWQVSIMFVTLEKLAQTDPKYADIFLLENYAAFQNRFGSFVLFFSMNVDKIFL